jgi:hypothetical protein
MKYVERSLTEGERIVYTTRRHWVVLVGPGAFAAVLAADTPLRMTTGDVVRSCIAARAKPARVGDPGSAQNDNGRGIPPFGKQGWGTRKT